MQCAAMPPYAGLDELYHVARLSFVRAQHRNPTITELSTEIQDGDEGCLSVPGIWAPTVRGMHCTVEGFDMRGEPMRVEGSGMLARCLQHEVDHLDGTVFLDRLTGEARKNALRALRSR